MNLEKIYLQKVTQLDLEIDTLQIKAIRCLQKILDQILVEKSPRFNFLRKSLYPAIKGLYIWGGVGTGKTFVMDIFYKNLPIAKKKRQHFSHFMQKIHILLSRYQGKKNPIAKIAYNMAKHIQVICFDEFFVEDIADAMILGNVFSELFKLGVILVATSNIQPKKLYQNGLQRESFLPAIDALIANTKVLNLDSGIDYRFRLSLKYTNYLYPCNQENHKIFFDRFLLSNNSFDKKLNIQVLGRNIATMLLGEKDVCFDFKVICGDERSCYDYIDICQRYNRVFIYKLTEFDKSSEDMARRFIALVDEFYDQSKKIIILASCDFKNLYSGEKLKFEFQRTISRLKGMQDPKFGVTGEQG